MTDETKKLFDAPWWVNTVEFKKELYGLGGTLHRVFTNSGELVTSWIADEKTANRLARLPELFDALLQATEDACRTCNHEKAEGILDRPCDDLHADECYVAEWRKLLRKVRDGK